MKSDWLPVGAMLIAVVAIFALASMHSISMWTFPALMLALLVVDLVSGKALNPLRGLRPLVVSRDTMPGHYWGAIALLGFLFAVGLWMALAAR